MRQFLVAVIALSLPWFGYGQCPGTSPGGGLPAPRLRITEELWASNGGIVLDQGEPLAPWLIALDVAPAGPLTPPGICIGLSPALQIPFDATTGLLPPLDASGTFALPLPLPPSVSLPGRATFFLQGVVFGPTGLGFTNGFEWNYRTPRVVLARSIGVARALDLYDGQTLFQVNGAASTATITNLGGVRVAFSSDGERMFVREISSAFTNSVQAFDVTGVTPVPLGAVTIPGAAPATDRMGVIIQPDDSEGYFSDLNGLINRFDADPASPTFLTALPPITTTITGPGPLALTRDGSLLFSVPGSPPPVTASLLTIMSTNPPMEIASAPLTDTVTLPLIGGASRGRIDLSLDDALAVTVSEGLFLAPGPFGGPTMGDVSIVDVNPGSPTFATELASYQVAGFGTRDVVFNRLDPTSSLVLYIEVLGDGDVVLNELFWPASTILRSTVLATNASPMSRPGSLQTTRDGQLLYVAVTADATLRVLDTATFTEVTRTNITGAGSISEINIDGR